MIKKQGIFFDPWDPKQVADAEFLMFVHPFEMKCKSGVDIQNKPKPDCKPEYSDLASLRLKKYMENRENGSNLTYTWPPTSHSNATNQALDEDVERSLKKCKDEATVKSGSPVVHPDHYNAHPSGVECIDVAQWFGFNLGNAIKYIWRCDHKGKKREDINKAIEYLKLELKRMDQEEKEAKLV